jgi:hypothetical protein
MSSSRHDRIRRFTRLPADNPDRGFRLLDFLRAPFHDIDERALGVRGKVRRAAPNASAGTTPADGSAANGQNRPHRGLGQLGEGRGPVRIPIPGPLSR